MTAARKLRAVAAPSPVPATPARAAAVYPQSEYLAAQWLAAVRYMQSRPGGSVVRREFRRVGHREGRREGRRVGRAERAT